MEIEKKLEGKKLTVSPVGRLDTINAPELEAALKYDGVAELVFDLSRLDYISSAGLRVLMAAQKQMMKLGSMTISGAKPMVKEVFDITGFSDIFTLV